MPVFLLGWQVQHRNWMGRLPGIITWYVWHTGDRQALPGALLCLLPVMKPAPAGFARPAVPIPVPGASGCVYPAGTLLSTDPGSGTGHRTGMLRRQAPCHGCGMTIRAWHSTRIQETLCTIPAPVLHCVGPGPASTAGPGSEFRCQVNCAQACVPGLFPVQDRVDGGFHIRQGLGRGFETAHDGMGFLDQGVGRIPPADADLGANAIALAQP